MLRTISTFLRSEKGRLYQYLFNALLLIAAGLFIQSFLFQAKVPQCLPPELADLPPSSLLMLDVTWNCGFPALELVVKVAVMWLLLKYWINPLAAVLMGFANEIWMLKDQQLQDDNNDSSALVNAFALLAAGWIIFMTPYTTTINYLANLLVRLPHAFIWAVIFTTLLVRNQLGMKKLTGKGGYLENFRLPKSEAVAIWTIVSQLLAAWLVVSAR